MNAEGVILTIKAYEEGRFDTASFTTVAEGFGGTDHDIVSVQGETVLAWEMIDPGYLVVDGTAVPQQGQLREEAILMWWDDSHNTSYMVSQVGGTTKALQGLMTSIIVNSR